MSSTRLPGKVLAPLNDDTVLSLLLRRLRRASELDEVLVATSTDRSDDAVEREARRAGVPVVRGPLQDVLGRFLLAAEAAAAAAVVRITADCPLTDPGLVDDLVRLWRATGADYVTNTLEPRTYPDGFDIEVVSTPALTGLGRLADTAADREHVTTYLRRHRHRYAARELRLEPSLGDVRVTLDTAEDLSRLRQLVAQVGPEATMEDVLRALGQDPLPRVMTR